MKAYNDIQQRGATPILCGGTGLYIESVLKGYNLSPVPQNQELRDRLARASSAAATASGTASASAGTAASASSAQRSRSIPSSMTGTPGTTIPGENGVRYYYVAKGEGLQTIAQKMYGKASMWNIIQEANKESIGERGILRIGMKLVIPPAQQ